MKQKNILELQKCVKEFVKERNWESPPEIILTHMTEELGEIAREILITKNYGERQGKEENNLDSLGEELSDLLYLIFKMANFYDLDLSEAFSNKMAKNSKRFPIKKK